MDEKLFSVYLTSTDYSKLAYAKLELPASPWELLDALDKARLPEGDSLYLEIIDYAGLNDPTPAHRLALLRQKLELEPENEETLWELFESAVTHVCIGKGGEISLSQKDQKECSS